MFIEFQESKIRNEIKKVFINRGFIGHKEDITTSIFIKNFIVRLSSICTITVTFIVKHIRFESLFYINKQDPQVEGIFMIMSSYI